MTRIFSNKEIKSTILLVGILMFAIVLRFYNLSTIPGSLTIDELAIGYNSFSLLHTGMDEFGKVFPLTYKSFGDWKLIGYPLVSMIPIALFGLSEFSVRFFSAVSGVVQVFLIFYLLRILFPQTKNIALFGAFFYTVSPWSIYFSRMAYEDNLATTFFLAGLILFLKSIQLNKSKYLIWTAILFGATPLTYHAYITFMPLFAFALVVYYRHSVSKTATAYISPGIFLIIYLLTFYALSLSNFQKAQTVTVFNNENIIYNRSDIFKTDGSHDTSLIQKTFFNKYTPGIYQASENYLATFSPSFLFDKGGQALMADLGYFGKFYLIDALFLIVGAAMLLYQRERSLGLLIVWLITAPITSAVTVDTPNSTRLFMMLPLFIIVSAYGAHTIVSYTKKVKMGEALLIGVCLLFLWNMFYFFDLYFNHINYQRAIFLHYGYKQAADVAKNYPNDSVVMTGPDNFPYISFLFYNQYDSRKFKQRVQYYPQQNGFVLVKSFDRYQFVNAIDYNRLQKKTLYIDGVSPKAITDPKLVSAQGTISSPSNMPIFHWFIIR